MKKLALCSIFLFLASTSAHAGIYLEPYLGYAMGKSSGSVKVTGLGTIAVDQDNSGVVFGGKAGYTKLGFAVGLDYFQMNSKDKDKTSAASNGSSTMGNLGGFVQFTFPILLKASATYILKSTSKNDNGTSDGSGLKLGVGFTGLPLININVDYITTKFTKGTVSTGTADSVDVKSNLYMLSVSVPFDL